MQDTSNIGQTDKLFTRPGQKNVEKISFKDFQEFIHGAKTQVTTLRQTVCFSFT